MLGKISKLCPLFPLYKQTYWGKFAKRKKRAEFMVRDFLAIVKAT